MRHVINLLAAAQFARGYAQRGMTADQGAEQMRLAGYGAKSIARMRRAYSSLIAA
jgi:hypothetical protein